MSKKQPEKPIDENIPVPSEAEGTIICGVIRHLGGDYLLVKCVDGIDRKARIPGKLRRKVWIKEGDIVLVGLWDYNSDKGDIVHKYARNEINKLVERGILSKEFVDAISELI